MLGLEGKVIFITGGNRGIGATITEHLEEMGAKVAYTYRTTKNNNGHLAVKADVTNKEEMEKAIETTEKELGPIFGVVANAGITNDGLIAKMTDEQWSSVIDTNLNGVYHTIRPIMPLLYERQEGSVIFISSVVGEQGNVGQANYAATKAALIGLGKALSLESARHGVRVNTVAPGFTETEMVKSIPDNVKEKILKAIPLRRFATELEIAWGVSFLLSPIAAGYITGTTLSINGGQCTK